MSYESDPSGQPLPGDSDSLNRSGHVPQEEQNSWLLDGETTPPASQPAQPEPVRVADSPNWLLDGEQAEEPSLVITEDTEGDSWLMNVDDPTATLEVDEVTQDQGFSASYCEPESTASVFGRLLVPAVFVSVLSVGGLLVWRSMSGLGVGPNGAGEGGVVHVPSENTGGEKLAGPTFAVPGTGRNANGSSTRGSIQRDGSVKQAKSGLSASVAQGQFGFTPSSQNTSTASKLKTKGLSNGEEHNHAETHEAPETLAQVEPAEFQTEGERLEGTPTVPSDLETAPSEENVDLAQSESVEGEGKVVIDLFGMAFVTADLESGSQELYQVQPSEDRLLSFESSLTFPMVGLPLWGPGTPVEPSIAMEFEEDPANVTGDPVDEPLLTEEQEQMLAMADEDGSVELAFLWVEEPSTDESVAVVEESTGFDSGDESPEIANPVEEQESAAVASLETEVEGTPLGHAFLDEL
ncbi:MAG: hypothetical protein P1V35_17510, partial [Planctomycetota bacterium]|nr:hypothetical protein [Planctomycetota bacterium]